MHLVGLNVGVVDGYVGVRAEGDAVEPVGQAKNALLHPFQLEVGAQHLAVELILLLPQLVGEVGKVPWGDCAAGRQFLYLLQGNGAVGFCQLVEQLVDAAGRGCHALFEHEVGVGGIAQ